MLLIIFLFHKVVLPLRLGDNNCWQRYKENINGKKHEIFLCESCADNMGFVDFSDLFSPMFVSIPEVFSKPEVKKCTKCDFGASTIIIISYEKDDEINESQESKEYGLIDTGIVVTHMCLEATNIGLGTTIVGLFDKEKIRKEFNIPRIYEPTLLLPIGYIDRKPSILHNRRNEVETFTKYDTY